MRKLNWILSLLILPFAFAGCSGDADDQVVEVDPNLLTKVEGGRYSGGVLRCNSIENYTTLFPVGIGDVYSTHIAGQGYEGLFKLNQTTLDAEPCIAETFDISKDKLVYTFHIRDGVFFHDNECFADGKGRQVTANDFKYCFEYICSAHPENKWPSHFTDKVVGAQDYFDKKEKSVKGIRVIDDKTLEITLINAYSGLPSLLAILCCAVYPEEAITKYGYDGMKDRIVGTGPFIVSEIKNGESAKFVRNENYWGKDDFGNKLPYLAQVTFTFLHDKHDELQSFRDGNLDVMWNIPVEEITNVMGSFEDAMQGKNRDFELQSINSLNVQYYGFLNTHEVFSDVKVRQAFNYAIDRDSLVEYVLLGEGDPAHNGFIPPMAGYPIEKVTGFDYDVKKAQQLMKEAGYPGGKGFPEITLNYNASGGINTKIGECLLGMLQENLGVNITMTEMPMNELSPKASKGQLAFWRFGWIADYPDPSNFLYMFHGKNIIEGADESINYFRYSSPEFDGIYDLAMKETDEKKRMELYSMCDQVLMDDAVVMPLYFNSSIRLINTQLRNFDINAMEYRDLSIVYYEEKKSDNVRVYDNLYQEEEEAGLVIEE